MDIIDKFSTNLKTVLTRALCLAVETNEQIILPEHLLWALGTQKGCVGAEILKKTGMTSSDFKSLLGSMAIKEPFVPNEQAMMLHLSDDAKRIVEKAVLTANAHEHRYIGTEHLLSGIVQIETHALSQFFTAQQTDLIRLKEEVLIVLKNTSKFPEMTSLMNTNESASRVTAGSGTAGSGDPTHSLEKEAPKFQALSYFGRELTSPELQKRIDPVIGRAPEIERVMEILCRRTKNNPLLVGEPGVGKTAVVEGLAKQIFEGSVPPVLQHKRVFAIDLALVVAGTMYRGEFEGRLRQIIQEASTSDDVILFIDELHTIVGAGAASGSMDAANILKPALARGDIHCIGATTQTEFKKHIETDSALERRFQTVRVEEPTEEAAMEILGGIAPHYETFHDVRISAEAIEHAVKLSARYLTDRRLPDKAIDLLDEAAASVRLHRTEPDSAQAHKSIQKKIETVLSEKKLAVTEERFEDASRLKSEEDALRAEQNGLTISVADKSGSVAQTVIGGEDVARVVSRAIGIPLSDLLKQDHEAMQSIETKLSSQVLGQSAVIETVSNALRRAKSGVSHPSRPLASFLFLGPSGVGKTELAKSIAEQVFHGTKHLIRLDMSEYSEGFTMSKLIGAPAGYVGYKEHANLTDRVRQKPYAVVLFDEIEKAHRDVQNLLLQILEEGELSDASGKMVNFKNTIVILTSNVGLEQFEQGGMGFSSSIAETSKRRVEDVHQELKERFRPELLNRIDHMCVFEPLATNILEEICAKQLQELVERMRSQGVRLTIAKPVTKHLVTHLDQKSGARSVRHVVQTHIESILSEQLLKKDHPKKLSIAVEGKKLCVRNAR